MIAAAIRARVEASAAWAAALLTAAVVLAVAGVGAAVALSGSARADAELTAGARPGQASESLPARAPSGDPLRVRIPAIGVTARLVPLGVNADGTLEVPRFEEAGWYTGGSRPGDAGPAVIAAHVDSTSGPAVFYRLKELSPGDVVHVDYGGGTVTFSVRESARFPKSQFPTEQVYGATDAPELRLVTCDGSFDRSTRSYTSNLVVWADGAFAIGKTLLP